MKNEIINKKLDLVLKAISIIPLFIASLHEENPNTKLREAIKAWEKVEKEYIETLKREYNNNTTSIEDKVS